MIYIEKTRKVSKKVKGMVDKFMYSLKLPTEPFEADECGHVLLEKFDHKTHAMLGNETYREILKSTHDDFKNDKGVWINNFYECVTETGDGMVRIFYDSDFEIISVQLYRLVAEKEMEIK